MSSLLLFNERKSPGRRFTGLWEERILKPFVLLWLFFFSFPVFAETVAHRDENDASRHAYHVGFTGSSADPFSGGDGSVANPYQVSSLSQLQAVKDYPGKNFILLNDIDASSTSAWNPDGMGGFSGFERIGTNANPFQGNFDGGGHVISGLYIHLPNILGTTCVGLFGAIGTGSAVSNLGLENIDISGYDRIGGLAGRNSGAVTGCYVSGLVSGTDNVGGLIGQNSGHVTRSYATAQVSGNSSVGGLVAWNYSGTISLCYATAQVNGTAGTAGGLVGVNFPSANIENSYAGGQVSGGSYIGGLLGNNDGNVINSYATGHLSGSSNVGGLVGGGDAVSGSFWDAETSGITSGSIGEGKNTAQMKTLSTFLNAGWDFEKEATNGTSQYWDADNANGIDHDGYPFLAWENGGATALVIAPTLTSFSPAVTAASEDTEVEITLTAMKAAGDEADNDGTVDAFLVQAVSTGTLKIGADAESATAFNSTSNKTIDASRNAYWTPASNANGTLNAFTVKAEDNDHALSSTAAQVTVSITAMNDDPTMTGLPGTTIMITEDGGAQYLGSALSNATFADADAGNGTVELFLSVDAGIFGFANPGGSINISGNGTGSAALQGTVTTIAGYLSMNTNITYTPVFNANGTHAATITITANDGGNSGSGGGTTVTLGSVGIAITAVNDAPETDLNGAGTGSDHAVAFTEEGGAVHVAPSATIHDVDHADLSSMTVTLTSRPDGNGTENLSMSTDASAAASGLTVTYTASTGVLSVSGSASVATYQRILQGVTYNNTSHSPNTTSRSITVVVGDGTDNSTANTSTLSITEVNNPPTLTSTGRNPVFTEGESAVALYAGSSASTVEPGQTFTGMTLTVSNVTALDLLIIDGSAVALTHGTAGTTVANSLSYHVSVTSGTNTVTLSGGAVSAVDLQTLINGISYKNTSDAPATSNRVVTITSLTDSGSNTGLNNNTASLSMASAVTVTAVNDAPLLDASLSPELATIAEDAPAPTNGSTTGSTLVSALLDGYSDPDGDAGGIAITGVNGSGTLYYSINGGTSWSTVGTVSPTSARVLYGDADTRLYYKPAANYNSTLNDVITFKAWDRNGAAVNGSAGVNTNPAVATFTGIGTGGYARHVALAGTHAYVANNYNSFVVVDIANPSNPVLVGSTTTAGQALGVAVSGNYAYVADNANGLVVMDVSDPAHPVQVGHYNSSGESLKVAVSGTFAYVADGTAGLLVIDITNPVSPVKVGELNTNDYANGVAVIGHYAYVADGNNGLLVIDISAPSNPVLVGHYDTAGNAIDVAVSGDYAYLADGGNGLVMVDIGNPASPAAAGHFNTGYTARGVVSDGHYAYIANESNGLLVVDVSDPGNPFLVLWRDTQTALGLAVSGTHVYIADGNGGFLVAGVAAPSFSPAGDGVAVAVTPQDDAPVGTGVPANITVIEDLASNFDLSAVTVANPDGDALPIIIVVTVSAGSFDVPAHGDAVGTGVVERLFNATTIVLEGTAADINSYLDIPSNIKYTGPSDASGPNVAGYGLYGFHRAGILQALLGGGNIGITGVNDAARTDLNGAGTGSDNTVSFTEDEGAVQIAPLAAITDTDNVNLSSMIVTLTNRPDGDGAEGLSLNTAGLAAASGLTVTYTASAGVYAVSGNASVAVYQSILQGVVYHNTSQAPNTITRSITVVLNDGTDNSTSTTVSLGVIPVNDAPVFISDASANFAENSAGTALDVNANDGEGGADDSGITYSVSGTDASQFNIDASTGVITFIAVPDFESPADADGDNQYQITVTADDGATGNNAADQNITITVIDVDDQAPAVIITTSASGATNASPIPVTVTFSETVTGFTATDLMVSGATVSNFAGSGTTYTFDLTPGSDGTLKVDIAASMATDGAGNVNVAASQFSILYDATSPTVSISSTAPSPTNTSPIPVIAVFSEPVTGFSSGDLTVSGGTVSNFTGSGTTYTFDLIPGSDGTLTVDISSSVAIDGTGNGNTSANQVSILYDATSPTVSISSIAASPTNTSPIPVVVVFSEPVTGFSSGDLSVSGGTVSNFAGSGATYTFDLIPGSDGTLTVDIAASVAIDGAGNVNVAASQFSILYDATSATVSISSTATSPTNTSPIPVVVVFSEPVTGFTSGDVTVSGGTVSNFTGSGATYTFDLTPVSDGTLTMSISSSVVIDAAGNGNTSANPFSILYDATRPSVNITSIATSPANTSPIPVTVTFNESVTGFTSADLTVSGGTISNFTGSGTTYTFDLTPGSDGILTVDLSASVAIDGAGNGNTAASPFSIVYNSIAPAGFSAKFIEVAVNSLNERNVEFQIVNGEIGSSYHYSIANIDPNNSGEISASGTVSDSPQYLGADLSSLANGTLELKVTLTNQGGNTSAPVVDRIMKFSGVAQHEIPQGFSPNGDGIDDDWVIPGIDQYPDNEVKIFNRYGKVVWETRGYNNNTNAWNSSSNASNIFGSSALPDGTYFYVIDLGDKKMASRSGYVIIKR